MVLIIAAQAQNVGMCPNYTLKLNSDIRCDATSRQCVKLTVCIDSLLNMMKELVTSFCQVRVTLIQDMETDFSAMALRIPAGSWVNPKETSGKYRGFMTRFIL